MKIVEDEGVFVASIFIYDIVDANVAMQYVGFVTQLMETLIPLVTTWKIYICWRELTKNGSLGSFTPGTKP